ncbi:hypothetical protein D3C75_954330 [compost metagenome]
MRKNIIGDMGCHHSDHIAALQRACILAGDKGSFALQPVQPAFLLQLPERLAHGLSAHAELSGDFVLRRRLVTLLQPSGLNPGQQFCF